MNSILLPYNNIVEKDVHQKFDSFLRKLIFSNDEKGIALAQSVKLKIGEAVHKSFLPGFAPMRNPTKSELDRRIDLCIDVVLELDSAGVTVQRINSVLEQKLKEKLGEAEETEVKAGESWGEIVSVPAEEAEVIEAPFDKTVIL